MAMVTNLLKTMTLNNNIQIGDVSQVDTLNHSSRMVCWLWWLVPPQSLVSVLYLE